MHSVEDPFAHVPLASRPDAGAEDSAPVDLPVPTEALPVRPDIVEAYVFFDRERAQAADWCGVAANAPRACCQDSTHIRAASCSAVLTALAASGCSAWWGKSVNQAPYSACANQARCGRLAGLGCSWWRLGAGRVRCGRPGCTARARGRARRTGCPRATPRAARDADRRGGTVPGRRRLRRPGRDAGADGIGACSCGTQRPRPRHGARAHHDRGAGIVAAICCSRSKTRRASAAASCGPPSFWNR